MHKSRATTQMHAHSSKTSTTHKPAGYNGSNKLQNPGIPMSVKDWQPSAPSPESDSAFSIDHQILNQFIEVSKSDLLEELSSQIPDNLQRSQTPLMTLTKEAWSQAAETFSNDEIIHLIRFFTMAEQQLDGWQAGAESPVIWLVKVLRQRQAAPDKELLLWIKAHSDNRFLPNGAL